MSPTARLRLPVLAWLAACARPVSAKIRTMLDPKDGVTREMLDQEEFNRKQGYAMGVTGEFFRYKHVFHKQPSEADQTEAINVAKKIKCDVCTVTVRSLLEKAKTLSEDAIADALEGNADYEPTGDHVTDRMLSHKKGCNKHFKDELIAEGWTLRKCNDVIPGRTDTEPCLWQESTKPNAQATDSYELWKEAVFHACEQTVARFGDSLAEHLAEALPKGGNRSAVVRLACETQARCGGGDRAAGSAGEAAAASAVGAAAKPAGRPAKRRRKAAKKGEEL